MKRNVLMSLAYEVIYLEKEWKERAEESLEWFQFLARYKEARRIMIMLFGSSISTKTVMEAREECREMSAFEMYEKYIKE